MAASNRRIWLHIYGKDRYPFDDLSTLDPPTQNLSESASAPPTALPPYSSFGDATAEAEPDGEIVSVGGWSHLAGLQAQWVRLWAWIRRFVSSRGRRQGEDAKRQDGSLSKEQVEMRGGSAGEQESAQGRPWPDAAAARSGESCSGRCSGMLNDATHSNFSSASFSFWMQDLPLLLLLAS